MEKSTFLPILPLVNKELSLSLSSLSHTHSCTHARAKTELRKAGTINKGMLVAVRLLTVSWHECIKCFQIGECPRILASTRGAVCILVAGTYVPRVHSAVGKQDCGEECPSHDRFLSFSGVSRADRYPESDIYPCAPLTHSPPPPSHVLLVGT